MISKEKLETFFYVLNRDYLPFGAIEEIFKNHVDKINEENKPVCNYKDYKIIVKVWSKNLNRARPHSRSLRGEKFT